MSSGNKRVSQLIELTSAEVANDDLFLIIDSSAYESKKIKVNNLSAYLNASGSIISIYADQAGTASWAINIVGGSVPSSSYSFTSSIAITSSYSLNSDSISSSYAKTASWAENAIGGGTTLITGSTYPITSSWATTAISSKTSSFLLHSIGINNGTASYSLTSQNVNHSTTADTASYFNSSVGTVATASYAILAKDVVNTVNNSKTASYLVFSPTNGTASYAISAGTIAGVMNNYGMVNAIAQTSYSAIINNLDIHSSLNTAQQTMIEVIGNTILNSTSSVGNNYSISLHYTDRYSGNKFFLDSVPVSFNVTPIINQWDSLSTSSINIPFNLISQTGSYGNYLLELSSSSPNLIIDPYRTVKFKFSSYSDHLTTYFDEPIDLIIAPSNVTISFSSSLGGPFEDNLSGLLDTGSQNITWISVQNKNVSSIRYTWKATSLTHLDCSNNSTLVGLFYKMPDTLETLLCQSCSILSIYDLSNTNLQTLDCSNNLLTVFPNIPITTSYINCSTNLLTSLGTLANPTLTYLNCSANNIVSFPTIATSSLLTIFADDIGIGSASLPIWSITSLPDTLFTASFNSTLLSSIPSSLPKSMSYLDIYASGLSTFPSPLPLSMSYLNVTYNVFNSTTMEIMTGDLVSNGILSGSLFMQGYTMTPTLLSNISLLILNNWTVVF